MILVLVKEATARSSSAIRDEMGTPTAGMYSQISWITAIAMDGPLPMRCDYIQIKAT